MHTHTHTMSAHPKIQVDQKSDIHFVRHQLVEQTRRSIQELAPQLAVLAPAHVTHVQAMGKGPTAGLTGVEPVAVTRKALEACAERVRSRGVVCVACCASSLMPECVQQHMWCSGWTR
jgi:hypothetical protein